MGMREHPLTSYARNQRTTLAKIAAAASTSRMSLHRIMRGENTTLGLLKRISDATDGAVTVEDLVSASAAVGESHGQQDAAPASSCLVNSSAVSSQDAA